MTTPSGKEFNLKELTNKEYLILLKFLNGENFKGFYNALNLLIQESIPEFEDLDICDKAYIYIAYYYYSVRSSISLKSNKFSNMEIPLTVLLDSLEEEYDKENKKIKLLNWDCEIHYPKTLIFDANDSIVIDFLSSLRKIKDISISLEECEKLRKEMPIKILNELEYFVSKNFSAEIFIAKKSIGNEEVKENLLSPAFFYSIAYIYKDMLENFYNMQYMVTHYIRVDWTSLLNMTPAETSILYKNFTEDKENQNKKNKGINLNDPNVSDNLEIL